MDIYCPKCGEPVDNDELHYIDGKTYQQASAAFFADGCAGIGMTCNDIVNTDAANLSMIARDLMGDDLDGIAGMMDDADYMGLI